ncbi:MAG TPA: TIGR00282 family metallophosphoesterase [Pirellulaceae bacterium]|jgi:hypothetical protein|nr:TIGR00282 family metallophosphoesterase [Pirellulaceae bacterium]
MRVLMIGDIVGKPGCDAICVLVPRIREERGIDFVIANGENAEGGSGISTVIAKEMLKAGVDCITLGDHVYRRADVIPFLQRSDRILKPANLSPDSPGRGWTLLETAGGVPIGVGSLLGRLYMKPVDCPFRAADAILNELTPRAKLIFFDYHAEATGEKQALGRYLDGRATAVLGTHTHVATADEQILPGGTGFQCDVGMTGPFASVLGRRVEPVVQFAITQTPRPFPVACDDVRLCGTIVEASPETGKAIWLERIMVRL